MPTNSTTPYKRVFAIIVAAGSSERMGDAFEKPKQYLSLGDNTVLYHTLKAFCTNPFITDTVVAIRPEDIDDYKVSSSNFEILPPVIGGKTRQDSVHNALEALVPHEPDLVLIHDAARPFVNQKLISNIIRQLDFEDAVVPAIPTTDTIKKCDSGKVLWTIDRTNLWLTQTPQGFDFKKIFRLHKDYKGQNFTDDSALWEKAGLQVSILPGSNKNVKISTIDDYKVAQENFPNKSSSVKFFVGNGLDVHAFEKASLGKATKKLILGGVEVPSHAGLVGHSDSDVVLHALVDAIFGAIGDGDIGRHFPDTDPKWSNANSMEFLKYARHRMIEKGHQIVNIDITIICETPKITPIADKMQLSISNALMVDSKVINIKGKTTEKMGFIGRGEGIAVQACVSTCK